MKDRKTYQREYYLKNRKKRLEYKKNKYASDPLYKERALNNSKIQSSLRSVSSEITKFSVEVEGKQEPAFILSKLTRLINRDKSVLYLWRKVGIIPKTGYFSSNGKELYSYSQVRFLEYLISEIDSEALIISYEQMSKILTSVWNKSFSEEILLNAVKEIL